MLLLNLFRGETKKLFKKSNSKYRDTGDLRHLEKIVSSCKSVPLTCKIFPLPEKLLSSPIDVPFSFCIYFSNTAKNVAKSEL